MSFPQFKSTSEVTNLLKRGFQHGIMLRMNTVSHIPDDVSFRPGSVLSVDCASAVCGLLLKNYLTLELPTAQSQKLSKMVLICGRSTSVVFNCKQYLARSRFETWAHWLRYTLLAR